MGATKTIAVSEAAYERLKRRKQDGESFSDVVERLAGERSLLEFAGTGTPDDGFADAVTDTGTSLDRSTEKTVRELTEEPDDT